MPKIRVTYEVEVPYGLMEAYEAGEDWAIEELRERLDETVQCPPDAWKFAD
jgi:hypothetical protein